MKRQKRYIIYSIQKSQATQIFPRAAPVFVNTTNILFLEIYLKKQKIIIEKKMVFEKKEFFTFKIYWMGVSKHHHCSLRGGSV